MFSLLTLSNYLQRILKQARIAHIHLQLRLLLRKDHAARMNVANERRFVAELERELQEWIYENQLQRVRLQRRLRELGES
jgi:hypothetical protein